MLKYNTNFDKKNKTFCFSLPSTDTDNGNSTDYTSYNTNTDYYSTDTNYSDTSTEYYSTSTILLYTDSGTIYSDTDTVLHQYYTVYGIHDNNINFILFFSSF